MNKVDVVEVAFPGFGEEEGQPSIRRRWLPSALQRRQGRVSKSVKRNARGDLDSLQQLIHLGIRQLLSQAREDVTQLSHSNEAVALLVEHLEATDELLCAFGSMQDGQRMTCKSERGACSVPAVPAGSLPPGRPRILMKVA